MAQSHSQAGGRRVVVVGAGIVGTCCALYLQREGFAVTLIERDAPGEAASFGNAGSLGTASVPPLGMPGIALKAPKMMFDPMHALVIRWSHLPRALPWFLRFIDASRKANVERIADARAALLHRVYETYEPLLEAAGAKSLIKNAGLLFVYEKDSSWDSAQYSIEMRRKRGVRVEVLSGDQAREMEPALGPMIRHGVFYPDVSYTIDPLRLTQTLAKFFVGNGGKLAKETVADFAFGADGVRQVITDRGRHDVDLVVIAAGVWSRDLARRLGTRLLLEAERGYHTVIPNPKVAVKIPLASGDRNVTFAPMEKGLRMTTMAEFCPPEAPGDHARANRMFKAAAQILPGLEIEGGTEWVGPRPSTPDSLPVIGPSPRHKNVLYACGHGHLGLTFAAVTGRLIADLANGRRPNMDISPYRADRF